MKKGFVLSGGVIILVVALVLLFRVNTSESTKLPPKNGNQIQPLPKDSVEEALISLMDNSGDQFKELRKSKPDNIQFYKRILEDDNYEEIWGDAMYGLGFIATDESLALLFPFYLKYGDPIFKKEKRDHFIIYSISYAASKNDNAYSFLKERSNLKYWEDTCQKWDMEHKDIIAQTITGHVIAGIGISGREDAINFLYNIAREHQEKGVKRNSILTGLYCWDVVRKFGIDKFIEKGYNGDVDLYLIWQKHRPQWVNWGKKNTQLPELKKNIPWHSQDLTDTP